MLTFHASVKANIEKSGLIIVGLMEKSQTSNLQALQVKENHWTGDLIGYQQTYKRWLWLAWLLAWLLALVWQPAVLRPSSLDLGAETGAGLPGADRWPAGRSARLAYP